MLIAMLSLCLTTQGQTESHLTFRRYTIHDGLPRMQTERVWQDSRGYIYIGTLSGFVRFDGRTFTPFLKGRRENIVGFAEVGGRVRALSFARQWIEEGDEVTPRLFDPQKRWFFNNLNGPSNEGHQACLNGRVVRSEDEVSAGSMTGDYVLMEDEMEEHRRLCRLTDEGFTPVLKGALFDEMTPDRKLYIDSATVYVPTARGLFRVEGRRAVKVTAKKDIYTLLRTESALLAFASDGIYRLEVRGKKSGMRRLVKADWTEAAFGLTVRRMKSGHLAIADEHQVYIYDGKEVSRVTGGINLIKDLLIDRWDRLWVATYQGLYCFFNRNFTNHRLADGDDIVRAVGTDGEGRLIEGTLNGKILVDGQIADDDSRQFYAPSSATIGGRVYMAGNGNVVSIGSHGLSALPLPQDRYQFVAAANGQLIVGGRKGVLSYHPETGIADTLTTEILHPWCAAADKQGTLWVGSSPGLYSISKAGAVSKTNYPQKLIITTMAADSCGNIFFASADSLFLIREGQVVPMNSQVPMLAGHEIRSLHVSPRGFLVIAVIDGLFVCRMEEDCRLSDARFYNHLNGFTTLEPQMATMAEMPDGTVWLAGVEEVTSFSPEDLYGYSEEDTFIAPPLRWWQHWWVPSLAVLLLSIAVWGMTRWIEKRRHRLKMIQLERAKLEKERQISAIRKKAIERLRVDEQSSSTSEAAGPGMGMAESGDLAKDIVKMTENTEETRLTIRTINGIVIANIADIAYFKANGNYTQMVTFQSIESIFIGIGKLEKILDPQTFVRADRSTLVNIHNISHLNVKQRVCIFKSVDNMEVTTTLLAPAFKRLESML